MTRLPLLLTTTQACRELGISRPSLYYLISRGLITAHQAHVGAWHRIPRSEVERLAEEGIPALAV